jgi:hypothetical protein
MPPGNPIAANTLHLLKTLHCLVLDGVYRTNAKGEPEFVETPAAYALACGGELTIIAAIHEVSSDALWS